MHTTEAENTSSRLICARNSLSSTFLKSPPVLPYIWLPSTRVHHILYFFILFNHYRSLYSTSLRLLLRSAPDPCTARKNSFYFLCNIVYLVLAILSCILLAFCLGLSPHVFSY